MKAKDVLELVNRDIGPEEESLFRVYTKQSVLMRHYIDMGDLPPHPIDITKKENQALIRDLIGRVICELAEGYKEYCDIYTLTHQPDRDMSVINDKLYAFNEEHADTFHFIVEIMIYANIDFQDIGAYIIAQAHDKQLHGLVDMHNRDDLNSIITNYCAHHLFTLYGVDLRTILFNNLKLKAPDDFILGGRAISDTAHETYRSILWDLTYLLQMANNELKAKPWVQNPKESNIPNFQQKVAEAVVQFFLYTYALGHTPVSLERVYSVKNYINLERVKSKY